MSSVLEKVRKLKASRPKGGGSRVRGIFHQWKDGDNEIRLVGEFLEVKTHFIAPAPKRNEKGLCRSDAFQGEDKLPQVINCPDWDTEREEWKKHKTCPICKLNRIAREALKLKPSEKEKEEFKQMSSNTYPRPNLKWNIVDRQDPFVLQIQDDKEEKVAGLKIATIGMEAWSDIEGIFDQMGFDITDPEEGIDIRVKKGHNGARTAYSAQAVMDGKSVKTTPLTDEEKAMSPHDLKQICGKQVDATKVMDALHEDYREMLELYEQDDESEAPEEKAEESKAEEKAEEPKAEKKAEKKAEEKAEEPKAEEKAKEKAETGDSDVDDAIDEAIDDDEDGLLGGTEDDSQKKN